MMNEHGKSDSCVVSAKLPNKGHEATQALRPAEAMEKRQLAKGNLQEQNIHRIQRRERVQSALERIRAAVTSHGRHHLRQEPDALVAQVRICAGGAG